MQMNPIRLHALSLPLRLAVTCLILILAGGLVASVFQMKHHYENKDELPGLSMDDIVGSFHGINKPARLVNAIETSMRGFIPTEEEYKALARWLTSDSVSAGYDSLDLGDYAPAEIIGLHCLDCHARGAGQGEGIGDRVPLEYWDDVKKVAFARNLDPVPLSILITSFHTHALTMPLIGLASALLFLAAGGPRGMRHTLILIGFLGLLVDFACWWLSRSDPLFCYGIVAGGAVFGSLVGIQLLAAFLSTWFSGFFTKTP
ncbi:MAG: hypothetical protein ABIK28_13775 [Planctomycetota bacterium]